MPTSSGLSRRRFLKSAAVAAAAPLYIPASALGQDGRPAPSERLTMGVIGIGNMGSGNLGAFLGRGDVQVVAVCDVRRDVRESNKQRVDNHYGGNTNVPATNDFRDLTTRDDIDLVNINTPDHWHALISIDAAKHGKDIYCEKPLSLTVREAQAMVEAVRRYGRVFQTGSQQRSSGEFLRACEIVRSGRIGRVHNVNVNVGGPSWPVAFPEQPIPDGFDWDMWLGPAPWAPFNEERSSGNYGGGWRQVRDYSGGMMTDWGAHHFDIAQWGLGMDDSGPVEITPPNVSDNGKLMYRYANGTTLTHQGGGNGVLFEGEDGWVEVNRGHFAVSRPELAEPIGPTEVTLYHSPGHHEDFLRCVKERRRPITDVAIGAHSATVCHLGNIAWWTGRTIHWNPDTWQIEGDEAAARWLDRPRRAPWRL